MPGAGAGGDVARAQDVGVAEDPPPHVVRGPRTDAATGEEPRALLGRVVAGTERERAVGERRGGVDDRPDARARPAEHLGAALGDHRRVREEDRGLLPRLDPVAERRRESPLEGAGGGDADLLADHRPEEHLGSVDRAGDADAGDLGHHGCELRMPREGLVDGERIGVQVEQPPHPRQERCEVGEHRGSRTEAEPAVGGFVHPEPGGAAGEPHRAREARRIAVLDPRNGVRTHPPEEPGGVDGVAPRQRQVDRARDRGLGRRTRTPGPQLGGRHPEHRADGLGELPDAGEPGREGHLGGREVRADEECAGGVRPLRAGQGEGTGAQLAREESRQMPRRVAEAPRETRHALTVDDPVGDQSHGAGRGIRSEIPRGRRGRRLGQAALAGAVPGLVRGGRRRIEGHVVGAGRTGRAARPTVDAGRSHRCDELPVEAAVARVDRAVPLVEGHSGVHSPSLTRPADTGWRKSDTTVTAAPGVSGRSGAPR